MNALGLIFSAVILLGGCSSQPDNFEKNAALESKVDQLEIADKKTEGLCGETLSKPIGMKISMAKQAFEGKQYYSSIATLEQIDESLITKKALLASAYRKSGQLDKAQSLYQSLLSTCISGNAAHGLGVIAAYRNDMKQAQIWLSQAVAKESANANIRNDYGFVLLSIGKDDAAREQFITALELDPNHQIAAKNLWLVLTRENETKAAKSLEQRFSWSPEEGNKLALAAKSFHPMSVE